MSERLFWEIHSGLPREGPGDNGSTRKAFSFLSGLPARPRILDIGCGPGVQTLELAGMTDGLITALDIHQPYLNGLKARAAQASIGGRIKIVNAPMGDMPFTPESFDVIWAESAIFIIGFEQGLMRWKSFLKAGGYLAVSELCWLKAGVPEEIRGFWGKEYPAMATVKQNISVIASAGYELIGRFILPESAWWNHYYLPKEERLILLRKKYAPDAHALREIENSQKEIDMYRTYSEYYGYVFFVMKKPV